MNTRWILLAALALAACDSSPGEPAGPGRLQVYVLGLPAGTNGQVRVAGPGGFSRTLTQSAMLTGLAVGEYRVSSGAVHTQTTTFAAADTALTVTVGATQIAVAPVVYAVSTGRLAILISGLPTGMAAPVVVTTPGGSTLNVGASDTLNNLAPGAYEVATGTATVGQDIYATQIARINVFLAASIEPAIVSLDFKVASGTITVSINGLPAGVQAGLHLTGPQGLSRDIATSGPVRGLLSGLYTITADTVTSGESAWVGLPATQKVNLATGASAALAVTYVPVSSGGTNVTIAGAHFQQIVQTFGGAVPLLSGRDALLRIFVLASSSGIPAPQVRARLYHGSTLVETRLLDPPVATAPTAVDEATLGASWNFLVPGALVKPGLGVLVDVDPANQLAESSETDNVWPWASSPMPVEVRSVPPLAIRFVPVTQSATGLTGRITPANVPQFLDAVLKLLPVTAITSVVAEPFTSNTPAFVRDDSNDAWSTVLSEVNALRVAEGGTGIYFGVVQTPYNSGIAGLAYLGGRTAVGWDRLPGGSIALAHELGHSFGRFHSPCGPASLVDANYPYQRGVIGVYGWSQASMTIVPASAADLMGYCTNVWVSDYTFSGMLNYRVANPSALLAPTTAAEPGVLVWGRIEQGKPVLEPSFDVVAQAALPRAAGQHEIAIRDDAGRVLSAFTFEPERVADVADTTAAHFAFVVPRSALAGRVASIEFRARGRQATQRAAAVLDPVRATRQTNNAVRLSWSGPSPRGVLVRDPATGRILALARRSGDVVHTTLPRLDLVVSDGVRSTSQRLQVAPR